MDLTESIAPRSDQLNAEDLLTGPRTFTIAEVTQGTSEQPVNVHLVEFPGRPFKPSKTVRRLMVAAWGKDSAAYVGRRMTLYRDPAVKFGGMDVGGIRVSHMSHLERKITVALTVTRGKRQPYVVEPLPDLPSETDAPIEGAQTKALVSAFAKAGITEPETMLDYCRNLARRPLSSSKDLTKAEASRIIDALAQDAQAPDA